MIVKLCSFVFLPFIFKSTQAIELSIEQGKLSGASYESRNGTKFHAFLGIPFAKPPVEELRFEPPQPPEPWRGVRNAKQMPPNCMQKEIFLPDSHLYNITGQEDCLYLNVYTPANTSKPLPVMFYIHGGAYIVGGSAWYDPSYFMDHDIIIVVIQYRLQILGFLSTADEVIPGNNGIKDQVAALKWVQKNIASFGGDPNQVTIFGESAGSSSVHCHLHSSLSKGLFHRAISQSGAALAPWNLTPPNIARAKAKALGVLTACSIKSSQALVNCLKKLPADEIVLAHNKFYAWDYEPVIPFGIVQEPNLPGAFLTENPWNKDEVNVVPWIVGVTSGEGLVKAGRYLHQNGKLASSLNKNYKRLFPKIFYYTYYLDDENEISNITETLKQFYFKNEDIGPKTAKGLVDLYGDGYFAYACIEAALRYKGPKYFYYYDHMNERSFHEMFGDFQGDLGASHADDLLSFFNLSFFLKLTRDKDLQVSKRLIDYWINFAYSGNPNSKNTTWSPLTSDNFEYLHIGSDGDTMKEKLHQERYSLWKNLKVQPIQKFTYSTDEL